MDRDPHEAVNTSPFTVSDMTEIFITKHLDHDTIMKIQGVFDVTGEDTLYTVPDSWQRPNCELIQVAR